MWNNEPSLAELEAWRRHPDTIARMAEVERFVAELRDREFEEADLAQKRLTQEREEQARRGNSSGN